MKWKLIIVTIPLQKYQVIQEPEVQQCRPWKVLYVTLRHVLSNLLLSQQEQNFTAMEHAIRECFFQKNMQAKITLLLGIPTEILAI